MNLPILSKIMLIALVAPLSCQRLQNEIELDKLNLTESKDINLNDLNEIEELTTIQSISAEDVTVTDDDEDSSTDDPVSSRQGRKLKLENTEGRFSIREKLCSLGLADCKPKERDIFSHPSTFDHSKIDYVQPVKVVPDGPPVPAISVLKKQDFSGSYDAPVQNGVPKPSYNAPVPADNPHNPTLFYGVPKPSYDAPIELYGAPTKNVPKPSYNAPASKSSYDSSNTAPAPTPSYGAPAPINKVQKTYHYPSYGAPASKPSFNPAAPIPDIPKPSYSYGALGPTYDVPKPSYTPSYDPPTSSYGAPASSYSAPAPIYNAPKTSSFYDEQMSAPIHEVPNSSFGDAPEPSYSAAHGTPKSSLAPDFEPPQTSFQAYPTTNFAQGVTVSNQPAPVYIPSASDYDSPIGTRLDPEDYDDEYDFDEDTEPSEAESLRHDRKLEDCQCVPSFQCPTDNIINLSNLIGSNNIQKSFEGLEQPKSSTAGGSPLSGDVASPGFAGIQDYSVLIDPRTLPKDVSVQDNSDTLDLSEESVTTLKSDESPPTTTVSSTTSSSSTTTASARFRRDESLGSNPQNREASEEELSPNGVINEYDSEDIEESEGSGDSEVLTRDGATIDLGGGDGAEVIEGRVFEGIPALANLLNFSTPKIGGLEPTVGVSFGLPQYGQSYGGQPFNYLNTGTAINPYYGGGGPAYGPNGVPSRISLGAVDINPLISFQSIANDKGELIKKPLINLHVTPNGCGLLGCDEGSYEDFGLQGYNSNPLAGLANLLPGFGKSSYNKGPSSHHHLPPPPPPRKTYGPPTPTKEYGFIPRPGAYEEPAPVYYDTFKTSPRPSYNYPRPPPPPQPQPQPPQQYYQSGSVKFGQPQSQVIKHEHHHHYHHESGNNQVQNGPSVPQGIRFGTNINNQGQFYGRSDENGTSEVSFKEDNTVKRNTNPKKKEESGFQFPKGRSLDQETNERRKRSTNEGNKFKRESKPFRFDAPTCGGPNSDYVCCRSSLRQEVNGNQQHLDNIPSTIGSSIRNPKSQESKPQNSISSLNQVNLSPKSGQCGKRNANGVNGRIASSDPFQNGDTDFAEYPWQVAILKKDQLDNMYVCGGSLIDAQHILTAAHCVKNYQAGQLRVRIGEWDVNSDAEFYGHIEFDVSKISIHKDFYPGNLFNDIALLRINGFVDFDKNIHISPACLPDRFFDFTGSRCQVTGWGKDAFTKGSYQQVLKEVEVPIINNQRCENLLRQTRLGPDFALHPGFLCAGGEEGRDACTGDGGGPLVCEANDTWQLVGIVSWGVGCGERYIPGVYVKVAMYEAWIQEQIGKQ